MTAPAALRIEGLRKTYDDGFEALKGIDLTVPQGEFYAVLGPNGAGKSTTIGIVCSLVRKTSGKVWINGIDIDEDFASAKRSVGVVPQEFNFSLFEKVRDIVLNSAGYQAFHAVKRPSGRITTWIDWGCMTSAIPKAEVYPGA